MEKDTKSAQGGYKITFHNFDLSAFFIHNLKNALKLDELQIKRIVNKEAEPDNKSSNHTSKFNPFLLLDVTNVKLTLQSGTTIYGEVTIGDFLVGEKNKTVEYQLRPLPRLTRDIEYDHWAYYLNNHLREAVHEYLTDKNAEKKENLKRIIKEIDDKLYPELFTNKKFGDVSMLHVMYFSFLEPVKVMTNNVVKSLLPKLKEQFGFISFDQFKEDEEKAATSKKESKQVAVSTSNAKIVRVNKGIILPSSTKRNVLITSALPYVNNVPHLGNIIGCVLSADVFARYCRLIGYNTLYVCGTDEYGTATETKALEEKKTPKQICDHYYEIHKNIYDWFDCDFDKFGRTSTEHQTKVTHDIFNKLHANGFTYEEVVEQQYCPQCNMFLADRFVYGECYLCHFPDAKGDQCDGCGKLLNATELIKPRCKVCNTQPVIKSSKHIFIDLGKVQPIHEEWFTKAAEKGKWTSNSVQFTQSLLKEGLKGRCITRDLKWGTPVPVEDFKDKVFYVWFDAPIGYLSITANYTEEWEKWWKNPENVQLYQFMGKDNITFHSVIFPCSLLGTKDPYTMLHHISTTEFLNYEIDEKTGKPKKFSKTRNTGVFGDDTMKTGIPCEVWRYYLLINRPEQSDTVFLWNDFMAKNNSELLANLGNFSNRILKFLSSAFGGKLPANTEPLNEHDTKFISNLYAVYEEYLELMEQVKLKEALKVAMEYSHKCNVYIQDNKPWDLNKTNKERCNQVVNTSINALRFLCAILEPFIPSFSAKVYEQMNIKRTERDETLLEWVKGHPERIAQLIEPGHQIGEPQPIFREITQAEIDNWKNAYSGHK